jgi:hypothetical protein
VENRITKHRFDVKDRAFNWAVEEMEIPQKDEKHLVFRPTDEVEALIKNLL